jgi:hypothetical protein
MAQAAPNGEVKARDTEQLRKLRAHCEELIGGQRVDRWSWWTSWREIAEVVLPRRYWWLVTPNQGNRGTNQINTKILDSTPTIAARVCASGMMAGITSPSRPWFRLSIPGMSVDDNGPVKQWIDEVERRIMRVFAESNYYQAKAVQLMDLTVFGTAPMVIYEDFEDVIRCYNPCAGEYFVGSSPRMSIDILSREFVYTTRQCVDEFGLENCTVDIQNAFSRNDAASLTREVVIQHVIEPNDHRIGGSAVPKIFPYRECYWVRGSGYNDALRVKGFMEKPFAAPRWDISGNDSYGRSPAFDALGDIKQLNLMTLRQAQGIDKLVNPPLIADVSMKNQPASLLPGGITYVPNLGANTGMRTAYEMDPKVTTIGELIEKVSDRIRKVFFNDLFMMISQLDKVRTATEIDARREEKLIQLGPVLERFQAESLDPDIDRVFGIMNRLRLLPPPPRQIAGAPIEVNYVSMLAMAQRAASTTAIERVAAFAGNLAAADPSILDNLNLDEAIDQYADLLDAPGKILRSNEEVAQIRAMRQKQVDAEKAMAMGMATAEGAKTLSEADVGGGQNALSAILGNFSGSEQVAA